MNWNYSPYNPQFPPPQQQWPRIDTTQVQPTPTRVIKVYLENDEIRKTKIQENITFDRLVQELLNFVKDKDLVDVKNSKFSYQDDEGDWIRFDTDEEWNECLRCVKKPVLKFKVELKRIERKQPPVEAPIIEKKPIDNWDIKPPSKFEPPLQPFIQHQPIQPPTQLPKPPSQQPIQQQPIQQQPIQEPIPQPVRQPIIQPPPVFKHLENTSKIKLEEEPAKELKKEEPKQEQYEDSLNTLKEMGFTNEDLMKELLIKYKGNIQMVVTELLQNK